MKQNLLIKWIIIILILAGIGSVAYIKYGSQKDNPTSTAGTQSITNKDQALQTLTDFLSLLHSGNYTSAEILYGGSYDILIGYNPDLDPSNHAQLLERACTTNGFNCLRLKSVLSTQAISEDEFSFYVELQLDNGGLFEIGPCCGEDEEGFVPISTFEFRVTENGDGQFQVLDLPPYTP